MRPGKLLLFVSVLLLCAPHALGQGPDSETGLKPGVVVEEARRGFGGAKSGLHVGDLLLRWACKDAGGKIEPPFGLEDIELEQAPRGPVRIAGLRNGRTRIWVLGHDSWQITTRPNFDARLLGPYLKGRDLGARGTLPQVIEQWRPIFDATEGPQQSWLRSWLWFSAAEWGARSKAWETSDQFYEAAIQSAPDSELKTREQQRWAMRYMERKEWDRAELLLDDAASSTLKTEGETSNYVVNLWLLGELFRNRGNFPQAQEQLGKALAIETRRVSTGDALSAASAATLAQVLWSEGNLADAERYASAAERLTEKLSPGSRNLGVALDTLARIAFERGELALAQSYSDRELRILRAVSGEGLITASALVTAARTLREEGDLTKAGRYFREALAIAERKDGDGTYVAAILNSLGVLAYRRGHLAMAESYLRRGLAIMSRPSSTETVVMGILNDLADVQQARGNLDGAERSYRQALVLREKLSPGTTGHAETLAGLAGLLGRKHQWDDAAKLYEQALNALESQVSRLGGSDDARAAFRAKHGNYYKNYIDLLMRQGQSERAFEILERSRARTLLETLAAAHVDVHKGADPALIEQERTLQQKLAAKSNYRIQLLGGTHTDEQVKATDREIADLLSQFQELEGQIRASNPAYAALTQPQPLTAKQVQDQLLDKDTVLLEYSLADERSHLFALTPTSLNTYELPKRAEIEKQARLVYGFLASRNQIIRGETAAQRQFRLRRAGRQYVQAAAELSRMLLSPVASEIGGKRLLVVADGALAYIPFAMLPAPGSGEPLVVEHEIVNLPSASVLAALRQQQAGRPSAPKAVAVLADPVFARDDARVSVGHQRSPRVISSSSSRPPGVGNFQDDSSPVSADLLVRSAEDVGLNRRGALRLGRLPFSRQEADAIAAVTPKGETLRALDFQASRATAMSAALAQYRIVHFATHGLLNSRHPELSGLVLSLVDERGQPQNGFLDLQDVYNMSLAADLVVLSACQTGLGKEVDGEGLVGLTRGFMYAGASRVVASLWNVSDEATARLMAAFYKAMEQEGMRPAAALRTAQLEMLRQKRWRDPYYWAAFQIQGEWK